MVILVHEGNNGILLHSELFRQDLLSFLAEFLGLLSLEKANKPKNEARKLKKFTPEEVTV